MKLRITGKQVAVAAVLVAEVAVLLAAVMFADKTPEGSLVVRASDASVRVSPQSGPWGNLLVQQVVAPVPSWLVVQSERARGVPGEVLGYTAVPAGTTPNVEVDLSASRTMPNTLRVSLVADKGRAGSFEYYPATGGGGGMMGAGSQSSDGSATPVSLDKPLAASGKPVAVIVTETYRDGLQTTRRAVSGK